MTVSWLSNTRLHFSYSPLTAKIVNIQSPTPFSICQVRLRPQSRSCGNAATTTQTSAKGSDVATGTRNQTECPRHMQAGNLTRIERSTNTHIYTHTHTRTSIRQVDVMSCKMYSNTVQTAGMEDRTPFPKLKWAISR